jgi:hypothetical protein
MLACSINRLNGHKHAYKQSVQYCCQLHALLQELQPRQKSCVTDLQVLAVPTGFCRSAQHTTSACNPMLQPLMHEQT